MLKFMRLLVEWKKIIEDGIRATINIFSDVKLKESLIEYILRGGKRIRPILCLTACQLVGGNVSKALNTAIAIECLHNATLMHDDVEDFSKYRRGKPTLHEIYNIPFAMNAGDGLIFASLKKLTENFAVLGVQVALTILNIVIHTAKELSEGQTRDITWRLENKFDLPEEEILLMLRKKTGSLIAAALKAGALCGDASEKQIKALTEFGYDLGVAFQIQDDVLNIIGNKEKYGKEIHDDIIEGKRTILLSRALTIGSQEDKQTLKEIFLKKEKDLQDIQKVIEIYKKYDVITYAQNMAKNISERAKKRLDIFPETRAKTSLQELTDYVIIREF